MAKTFRVAGINFDHMHMGDLLRLVHQHHRAEIVGIADETASRMETTIQNFSIPRDRVFADWKTCLEQTKPDVVILCPATARHAEYVEHVAPYGVNVLLEKPFAASVAEADRMILAVANGGGKMVINWPLAWYPPHRTAKRLLDQGAIGDLLELHYYDGNRGPLAHRADKVEVSEAEMATEKSDSWWYQKSAGGGSLLDYLGYGVTLGTWFQSGRAPLEVTSTTWAAPGLAVDEHSITVCRYEHGLSKFETRWGTFSDPWTHQPQPRCGFVLVGSSGTIASYDYAPVIHVQTRANPETHDIPVDTLSAPHDNPINHFLHCLETGESVIGPLDPQLCRLAQRMVDSAVLSSQEKRSIPLL